MGTHYSITGTVRKCPACGEDFRGYMNDAYGKICPTCRNDFGINDAKDAQTLIDALDTLPEEGRKQAAQIARNSRKTGRSRSAEVRVLPAPKIDKTAVAAAIRSQTSYGLTTPLPEHMEHPTSYVIAKNGLFEIRDTDIARITLSMVSIDGGDGKATLKHREVVGLEDEMHEGVELKLPRIPYDMLCQTVAFFRGVCGEAKGSSEAIVRIWWNVAEKRYEIRVPEGDQRVSGASVHHVDNFDLGGERDEHGVPKYLLVMDIHSHGSTMDAFWSGVDDGDERKAPEGRMFGVIGRVMQPMPTWRWRMRTREGFISLGITEVFSFENVEAVPFVVKMDVILSVASAPEACKDGQLSLRCPVDPFKDAVFPKEWLNQVKTSGGWSGGTGHHGGFRGRVADGNVGGRNDGLRRMFIYIRSKTNRLEEFEVSDGTMKATGKYVEVGPTLH